MLSLISHLIKAEQINHNFYITYEGYLFIGYEPQQEIKNLEYAISVQNEKRIIRNEILLVRGTWFAGIAAVLLLL